MPQHEPSSWQVEVYFDGACPLCSREIALLRRLDRRGRIRFSDITAPDFDPKTTGHTPEALMERIRGRLPDGTPLEGVEVFRQLYAAVGLGFVVALTRLPGISHLLEVAYELFARHRLKLTGRCVPGADGVCAVNGER